MVRPAARQHPAEYGPRLRPYVGWAILCLSLSTAAPAVVAAEEATAIRTRMATIEIHLACGATSWDTVFVYRVTGLSPDTPSLAPYILEADGQLRILAVARHKSANVVDSIVLIAPSGECSTTRKAGTNEFETDQNFRAAIVNTPEDLPIRVRLCGTSCVTEFSMVSEERRAWRDLSFYRRDFLVKTLKMHSPQDEPTLPINFVYVKPSVLRYVQPQYPEQVRKDSIEGDAVVEVLIDTLGTVRTALTLKSSGHRLLDVAAVRAALDYVFSPQMSRGKPMQCWVSLPFRFRLN